MNWIKRILGIGTKSCAIQNVISIDLTCECEEETKYDCEVHEYGKDSVKMKLCKSHIKSKCEQGLLVSL